MASPIEQQVMEHIGFGVSSYRYFEGADCVSYRYRAARQIKEAIRDLAESGAEIVPPDEALCDLVTQAARLLDTSNYSLKYTWRVAADVIQGHINAFTQEEAARSAYLSRWRELMIETYFGDLLDRDSKVGRLTCSNQGFFYDGASWYSKALEA